MRIKSVRSAAAAATAAATAATATATKSSLLQDIRRAATTARKQLRVARAQQEQEKAAHRRERWEVRNAARIADRKARRALRRARKAAMPPTIPQLSAGELQSEFYCERAETHVHTTAAGAADLVRDCAQDCQVEIRVPFGARICPDVFTALASAVNRNTARAVDLFISRA